MNLKQDHSRYAFLKATIRSLLPDIPEQVFQEKCGRSAAEKILKENREIPFIVRKSSIKGYFALDAISVNNSDEISRCLIKPPTESEREFTLWFTDEQGFQKEKKSFQSRIKSLWNSESPAVKKQKQLLLKRWEMFKDSIEIPINHYAVLSLQTLEMKKKALTPEQVNEYYKRRRNKLLKAGDGHTGFAMALALGDAPFVVIRSKGQRGDAMQVLRNRIRNNDVLVITGHSSPESDTISGVYVNLDRAEFRRQIHRGPQEIVSFSIESGLKRGEHLNILLSICYGAKTVYAHEGSFAHKLAESFAREGISTTILASDSPVNRFGTSAIINDQIEFSDSIGINPDSLNVIFTDVAPLSSTPITVVFKPYEKIILSKQGIRFVGSDRLEADNGSSDQELEIIDSTIASRRGRADESEAQAGSDSIQCPSNSTRLPLSSMSMFKRLPMSTRDNRNQANEDSTQPVQESGEGGNTNRVSVCPIMVKILLSLAGLGFIALTIYLLSEANGSDLERRSVYNP